MKGMSPIVQNTAGLLCGFVMLYGVYVTATGHLAPGGGFTGGVIIMGGAVMLILAFGGERARELTAEGRCHVFDGIGALAFAVLGLLGLLSTAGFFYNFLPAGRVHSFLSGGFILPANLAIALKVGAGLIGIFLALVVASRQVMTKE